MSDTITSIQCSELVQYAEASKAQPDVDWTYDDAANTGVDDLVVIDMKGLQVGLNENYENMMTLLDDNNYGSSGYCTFDSIEIVGEDCTAGSAHGLDTAIVDYTTTSTSVTFTINRATRVNRDYNVCVRAKLGN